MSSVDKEQIWDSKELINTLQNAGVVVMPTDTIYGIVGSALNLNTVERIYEIRHRAPSKPCIILIWDMSDLEKFGIHITDLQKDEIIKYIEPTSFILDCPDDKFSYLHRGTNTLCFRLPKYTGLRNLLKITGPLVAPSANIEGAVPSVNITDAKNYFGDAVDLYIDGGEIHSKASKIIKLHKDGSVAVLRE